MELLIRQPICVKTVQNLAVFLYGTSDVVFKNGNLLDFRRENIIIKNKSYYR